MERDRYLEQVNRYVANMKSQESIGDTWNKKYNNKRVTTVVLKEHLPILEKFDEHCKLENFTIETRKNYLICLRNFFSVVKKPIEKITKDDIKSYLSGLQNMPKTIQVKKTVVKYFFKWYFQTGNVYPDLVAWINTSMSKKDYKKLPKDSLLTQEEVLKIANAAMTSRNKAFILVLYESACRISELLGLRIRDVLFDEYGAILKVSGKTGERTIRLLNNEGSVFALKTWMNEHPFKDKQNSPIFVNLAPSMEGDFIGKNYMGFKIRKWCRIAGINKKVYPHLFRHSRLTELAKKGYNESFLRKFAGWEGDSRMADIYISLSSRDIDDVMLEKEGIKKIEASSNEKVLAPIACLKCGEMNSPTNLFCQKCASMLNEKSQDEIEAKREFMQLVFDPEVWALMQKKQSEMKK